jgi:hypothetical protein
VWENTGDDAYAVVHREALRIQNFHDAATGDVDGDGRPEFVVGGGNFGDPESACWHFGLYRAEPGGDVSLVWVRDFVHGTNALFGGAVDLGDTNGDGRAELALSMGNVVHVYEFGPGFQSRRVFEVRDCDTCDQERVYLRDLDGDGRAELIVSTDRDVDGKPDPDGIHIYERY